eukprot:RCo005215
MAAGAAPTPARVLSSARICPSVPRRFCSPSSKAGSLARSFVTSSEEDPSGPLEACAALGVTVTKEDCLGEGDDEGGGEGLGSMAAEAPVACGGEKGSFCARSLRSFSWATSSCMEGPSHRLPLPAAGAAVKEDCSGGGDGDGEGVKSKAAKASIASWEEKYWLWAGSLRCFSTATSRCMLGRFCRFPLPFRPTAESEVPLPGRRAVVMVASGGTAPKEEFPGDVGEVGFESAKASAERCSFVMSSISWGAHSARLPLLAAESALGVASHSASTSHSSLGDGSGTSLSCSTGSSHSTGGPGSRAPVALAV